VPVPPEAVTVIEPVPLLHEGFVAKAEAVSAEAG